MNQIKCVYCSLMLDTEVREDGKTYVTEKDFDHIEQHLYPDHNELREEQEAIERIENYI